MSAPLTPRRRRRAAVAESAKRISAASSMLIPSAAAAASKPTRRIKLAARFRENRAPEGRTKEEIRPVTVRMIAPPAPVVVIRPPVSLSSPPLMPDAMLKLVTPPPPGGIEITCFLGLIAPVLGFTHSLGPSPSQPGRHPGLGCGVGGGPDAPDVNNSLMRVCSDVRARLISVARGPPMTGTCPIESTTGRKIPVSPPLSAPPIGPPIAVPMAVGIAAGIARTTDLTGSTKVLWIARRAFLSKPTFPSLPLPVKLVALRCRVRQ
jgi:hypothetical protein